MQAEGAKNVAALTPVTQVIILTNHEEETRNMKPMKAKLLPTGVHFINQ